jgi:hypothetical protein
LWRRRPSDSQSNRPVILVTLEADESQPRSDDPDYYRMYHVIRFFRTTEGFYEVSSSVSTCTKGTILILGQGELDLTGRHAKVSGVFVCLESTDVTFTAIRVLALPRRRLKLCITKPRTGGVRWKNVLLIRCLTRTFGRNSG